MTNTPNPQASLKARFEEMIHLEWDEFYKLEHDKSSSIDDSVLCSLIRICAGTDDIAAIKLAFDRIDGLQDTLIEIKVPKFYTRYINAKEVEPIPAALEAPKETKETKEEKPSNYDPATAKLRETLREMRDMPRDVIRIVLLHKMRIEKDKYTDHKPMVKSVIVANLLKNVQKGKFKAVELVFDQIDGKLPKAIQLLGGDDVYVDDTTELVAPSHAELGEDGIYYAENKAMTTMWLRGFAKSQKGLEILAEGLDDE
jgi:hypothetical protein